MLPGMSRALSPKGRVLRHPGDLQWLERRRRQAADLFAQGAAELGVSAQTTSRWYARWRDGGAAGMRTARQGSRPGWDAPSWPGSGGCWTGGGGGRVR
jgi:leucine-zipper of insertion element IS481